MTTSNEMPPTDQDKLIAYWKYGKQPELLRTKDPAWYSIIDRIIRAPQSPASVDEDVQAAFKRIKEYATNYDFTERDFDVIERALSATKHESVNAVLLRATKKLFDTIQNSEDIRIQTKDLVSELVMDGIMSDLDKAIKAAENAQGVGVVEPWQVTRSISGCDRIIEQPQPRSPMVIKGSHESVLYQSLDQAKSFAKEIKGMLSQLSLQQLTKKD